jgi:phage regulator Rha-like protein
MKSLIPLERIEQSIYLIRGQKVMIDSDLAKLYGTQTRVLMQAVKRNNDRFPKDFMFQLTEKEVINLKSQFVTSSWGGRRKPTYVFTEHGALMAANVLNSKRAVQMSIQIVRTFAKLRQLLFTHADLARKLNDLEQKYDKQFKIVFDAIRQLMMPPEPERKPIGFK